MWQWLWKWRKLCRDSFSIFYCSYFAHERIYCAPPEPCVFRRCITAILSIWWKMFFLSCIVSDSQAHSPAYCNFLFDLVFTDSQYVFDKVDIDGCCAIFQANSYVHTSIESTYIGSNEYEHVHQKTESIFGRTRAEWKLKIYFITSTSRAYCNSFITLDVLKRTIYFSSFKTLRLRLHDFNYWWKMLVRPNANLFLPKQTPFRRKLDDRAVVQQGDESLSIPYSTAICHLRIAFQKLMPHYSPYNSNWAHFKEFLV